MHTCQQIMLISAFLREPKSLDDLERRWNTLASYIFMYNDTLPTQRMVEVAEKIKQEYFDCDRISMDNFDTLVDVS